MIKIKFNQGERIALTELRSMLPFFLIINGLVLIICGFYGIFLKSGENIGFSLFTGLLFGNIVSALNFYFIGMASGRLLQRRGEARAARARSFAGFVYAARFLGMFALYWFMASFGLINLFTALIPLLYPSFYYKIKAIFNKTV